jgi:hypothetical protein
VLQAWLDDHDRKFGHFIDNKWVSPEGRKTYETKCPATGFSQISIENVCVSFVHEFVLSTIFGLVKLFESKKFICSVLILIILIYGSQ